MSHTDLITKVPLGFKITSHSADCPVAAMENKEKNLYAVQFHPEVAHTTEGMKMLSNFVKNICKCTGDWKMSDFAEIQIKELKQKALDEHIPIIMDDTLEVLDITLRSLILPHLLHISSTLSTKLPFTSSINPPFPLFNNG